VFIDDDKDKSNSSYAIGGGMAGLFVILSLILVIICCIKKNRNCKGKQTPGRVINNSSQYQETPSAPPQMEQSSLPPPHPLPPYSAHNTIPNNNGYQPIVIFNQVNQATVQYPPFVIQPGNQPTPTAPQV